MSVTLPLTLSGEVTIGNGLGRTISVPTANISINENIDGLAYGVYYSTTLVDGVSYKSISNIGTKPTVKEDVNVNAETFIFDFEGDLYGREIKVTLLKFRRPEEKFSSFEELTSVIKEDIKAGMAFSLN
ncbi:MAG: riboflavin kinase [Lachnospiraceae bacterium]|nr:riboflavin kinase [Lachnospiraceae bacterium]